MPATSSGPLGSTSVPPGGLPITGGGMQSVVTGSLPPGASMTPGMRMTGPVVSTGLGPLQSTGQQPPSLVGQQPPSLVGQQPPSLVGQQPQSLVGQQPPSLAGQAGPMPRMGGPGKA